MLDATVIARRALSRLGVDHATLDRATVRAGLDGLGAVGRRVRAIVASSAEIDHRTGSPHPRGHARGAVRHVRRAGEGAPLERLELVVDRVRHALDVGSGAERVLPIAVAVLVLAASALSAMPVAGGASLSAGAAVLAGWASPDANAAPTARLTIGGTATEVAPMDADLALEPLVRPDALLPVVLPGELGTGNDAEVAAAAAAAGSAASSSIPFADDATLLKPIAPDSAVVDASDMITYYRVRSGDTLSAIAAKFGVSTMTLVWSNELKSKDLSVGMKLAIPPVSGAVIKVEDTDTLASIAKEFKVSADKIVAFNKLKDPSVQLGQLLVIPGGRGVALPPDPVVAPIIRSSGGAKPGSSAPSRTTTYAGGRLRWPVGGGYLSQRYHYGHYGVDIAADRGTPVYAAAAGTVIFSGWYRNGGGYQVWISHGSGLYTTYNHMSGVAVSAGAQVAKGTRVGRVGSTGRATGPHLHFEVWRGRPWSGGTRFNPLGYF